MAAKKTYKIFSYGSNNVAQLESRLGHPIIITWKAIKFDAACVYTNSKIAIRNGKGGVATIVTTPKVEKEVVLGFVFEATEEDIKILNECEGVQFKKYYLANIIVHIVVDREFVKTAVYAYVMTPEFLKTKAVGYVEPSKEYLEKIAETKNAHWKKLNGKRFTINDIPLHSEKKICGENPKYFFQDEI
jgi:hypothetical protein